MLNFRRTYVWKLGFIVIFMCVALCDFAIERKEIRCLSEECCVFDVPQNKGIWNLSVYNVIGRNKSNRVVLSGDTVYSETVGGYRLNYNMSGGKATIKSLQSNMGAVIVDSCWQQPNGDIFLRGSVRYAGEYRHPVMGEWTRSETTPGMFIGFDCDTVYNVIAQTDFLTLRFANSGNDEYDIIRIERCRWITADDNLPIAVATRVGNIDNSGKYNPGLTLLCSEPGDKLKSRQGENGELPDTEIRALLESLSVSCSGGLITIEGNLSANNVLTADIIDNIGNSYIHSRFNKLPAQTDVSALAPGAYIVVMAFENMPSVIVKQLIIIH